MAVEIIAEIAQAHEGSLGIAHSYIDALAELGVNTIKFQMHIAEAESSEYEQFRVPFSYEDKTRFDYWKRMEFTHEQWIGLKEHCNEKSVNFLCSPFSIKAVHQLEKMGEKRIKIASGEVSNALMHHYISQFASDVLISSGLSSMYEIEKTVQFFQNKNIDTTIFECTTQYPTPAEKIGLQSLLLFRKKFNLPVGLSDHSGEIYASLAAVALGAEKLEFHAVFDKSMFGPDAKSSLDLLQIKQLVRGVREIEKMLGNQVSKDESFNVELKNLFGKSLAINKGKMAGEEILLEDLETKKPGNMGISAQDFEKVIHKKLRIAKKENEFLQFTDFE